MKTLINGLAKGIAGFIFVALLAVNVQIGSGSSFFGIGNATVANAKADCPDTENWCSKAEFPDGTVVYDYGDPIIVTPDEN